MILSFNISLQFSFRPLKMRDENEMNKLENDINDDKVRIWFDERIKFYCLFLFLLPKNMLTYRRKCVVSFHDYERI